MNFIKLFLVAILATTLFACNNDAGDAVNDETEILGEWEVTDIYYEGTSTTSIVGIDITSDFIGVGDNMDLKINFTDNPKEYVTSGDYSVNLETTTQGQTTNTVYTSNDFAGQGTWDKTNNSLTFVDENGMTQTSVILELTPTTLKLKQIFIKTETQQGATVTQNITATYTFTK